MYFTPCISHSNLELSFWRFEVLWPLVITFSYLIAINVTSKFKLLKPLPNYIVLLYNLAITILSLILFIGMSHAVYVTVKKRGSALFLICDRYEDKLLHKDPIMFWMLMYWVTKVVELLDTFLKISNGSKVSFLHAYHHSSMSIGAWWQYYYDYSMSWMTTGLNSLVHVIMYGYYVHLSINKINGKGKPKWGIYVTYIQLIQFWMGFTYQVIMVILMAMWGRDRCYNTKFMLIAYGIMTFIFIGQFTAFFQLKYRKKKPKKEE